jgi:hypothetical protein
LLVPVRTLPRQFNMWLRRYFGETHNFLGFFLGPYPRRSFPQQQATLWATSLI